MYTQTRTLLVNHVKTLTPYEINGVLIVANFAMRHNQTFSEAYSRSAVTVKGIDSDLKGQLDPQFEDVEHVSELLRLNYVCTTVLMHRFTNPA